MAQSTRDPVFVKPAPGSFIRHPGTMRPMPEDGFEVRGNDTYRGYWNRMIRTGDLVVVPQVTRAVPRMPAKKED
jgi:hypothetical protein